MKILGLLFLSAYSSHLLALTCSEAPTINLSDAGGSLENLRVTDQNGLGICHIEQLHKLLKAKIPGHPDLARVQMTIAEKEKRDANKNSKRAIGWMTADLKEGSTYINAGDACEAYELIKGSEICLAENDQFEQMSSLAPASQSAIINRLAYYFDNNKKNPQQEIMNLIKYSGTEIEYAWGNCSVDEKIYKNFKNAYLTSLSEEDKKSIVLPDAKSTKLSIPEILSGKTYSEKLAENFKTAPESDEKFQKAHAELLISYRKTENCLVEKIKTINDTMYCAPINNAETRALELNQLGMDLTDIVRVLNGDQDRDKFFKEVFNCRKDQKVKIPELSCKNFNLLPLAKAATVLDDYHKLVAGKIDQQLALGSPVGISTCTRYFKNPSATTVDIGEGIYNCGDTKNPQYKKGEGSHAVTIIGSRCVKGEQQYLVQNSWGTGCFYADEFECTKKGGFWASASSIINNTRSLNYME